MHLQARASTKGSAFADDDEGGLSVSAKYPRGRLSEILRVLAENDFNLRTAGGRMIELGGEFAFAVADRDTGDHDERATEEAVAVLVDAGFDAHVVAVEHRVLDNVPGALLAFVDEVRDAGLLIEEIEVGTPDDDGRIPVQMYTVKAGGSA